MKLHLFNPEHDIALASGLENFTAPHAGRQLRHDLGWIAALWANEEDDAVLVEDGEGAQRTLNRLQGRLQTKSRAQLMTKVSGLDISSVDPWGWNAALRSQLVRMGVKESVLPSKEWIEQVRALSHRRTAAGVVCGMKESWNDGSTEVRGYGGTRIDLRGERIVGEMQECRSEDEVKEWMGRWGKVVMKAPWSSSGRGIRFVESELSVSMQGWLRNTLSSQKSVMVEPMYNKVKDFAMEFCADGKGGIAYQGLSLFHTSNGAYTGNLLATEEYKQQCLGQFVGTDLLRETQKRICELLAPTIGKNYAGPFGIDMMIVGRSDGEGYLLHPCVEINLRRTMGHVALDLTRRINPQNDEGIVKVMRIVYENNQYKLKLQRP